MEKINKKAGTGRLRRSFRGIAERLKNLSIRKALFLYTLLIQSVCFFTAAIVIGEAEDIQQQIWEDYYSDSDLQEYQKYYTKRQSESNLDMQMGRIPLAQMASEDAFLNETMDFVQTWSYLFFAMLGNVLAILLFYHLKLKVPFRLLEYGTRQIADQNLDFEIPYSVRDEMGALCAAYEKMRVQLLDNYARMWHMAEQERLLKNTISHDLRAPLSVLSGYQEMMTEFVSEGETDKEQLLSMLASATGQLQRMNLFLDKIAGLDTLEDWQLQSREESLPELIAELRSRLDILCGKAPGHPLHAELISAVRPDVTARLDKPLVLEVYDNLISNAVRYAQTSITVEPVLEKDKFIVRVYDDGKGFGDIAAAEGMGVENQCHFGIGLYICECLCRKHGGRLLTGNRETGGAYAVVEFEVQGE